MTHIINSKGKPLATDQECLDRRTALIAAGIITPCDKSQLVNRKDSITAVSTKEMTKTHRKDLIAHGFISPIKQLKNSSVIFCELPPVRHHTCSKEEGEYQVLPITNDEEYTRRCQTYFRMIQEILYARKSLKLILGNKQDSDPDWFF